MASIAFYILLTLTLSSTCIHARESQFFNKFSTQPLNTDQQQQPLTTSQQQQEEQPEFIPQSQDSGSYGLYGHESGQLPPSATTNLPDYLPENYNPVAYTTPIHSTTQDIPNELKDPQPYHFNGDQTRLYNSEKEQEFTGTNMYNSEKQQDFMGKNMYNSEKQVDNGRYYYGGDNAYKLQKQGFEFDDSRFMETEDGGNMYNAEKQYRTSNNGNMYNPEKQGMSDTRFLENGKYYYDLNMENLNSNANMNTRGLNSRNEYKTQGYYGNVQNSYDRYHFNGGYQNPEDQFNP